MENFELINRIKEEYPYLTFLPNEKLKSGKIENFPIAGFDVEIKPTYACIFVFHYNKFILFNKKDLKIYFENHIKYKNAKYYSNLDAISVSPRDQNNVAECVEIFKFTESKIKELVINISTFLRS